MQTATIAETVHKVTSVVRADAHSGHLVRAVVVSPKVVIPKAASEAGGNAEAGADSSVDDLVEQTARAYDLDPALVHSIIKVESNHNPYAVSNKGAQGLMQLMPSTAKRMGVKNSFNPKENIEAGVRYYKYLQTIYKDDRLALAAYNAGEGAVAKYKFQVPPYPETVNYVYRVGKSWGEAARRRRTQPAKTAIAAMAQTSEAPAADQHPKLEQYRDEQGRINFRTARQ